MSVGRDAGAPLLERGGEQEALTRALAAGVSGPARLVIVEGPAGIGKSRLLELAGVLARERGVRGLSARGSELEQSLALGVAQQLVGAELDLADAAFAGAVDRSPALLTRLLRALVDRLACDGATVPGLLRVDDAQWADEASLRFLCHLALRLDELPIAIVIAIRTGETTEHTSLLTTLRASRHAEILAPAPLSGQAVDELLRAQLGPDASPQVLAACERVTGGYPFFVVELLRAIADGEAQATVPGIERAAPRTVLHAVMARLARHGPNATAIATALSVLDMEYPIDVAAELAGVELPAAELAADALARAGILAPGNPLRFAHPLIASTLRRDIGAFSRDRLHARAACLLARRGAPVERIGVHLLHAPPAGDAAAVAALRGAARLACQRGEPRIASRLLERALAEPPERVERAATLLELADAEVSAGSTGALGHLDDALVTIEGARPRAEACLALARTLHHTAEFERAAEVADRGRRELAAEDPLHGPLRAAWVAAAMLAAPLHERLARELEPMIAAARRGIDPDDPAMCGELAAWIVSSDEPPAIVERLALAAVGREPLVDGDSRGTAFGFAVAALVYVDALDPAGHVLDAADAEASRCGFAIALSIARHFRAYVRRYQGRLADAVLDAEASLEVQRFGETPSAWSTPVLALARLDGGDARGAAEAIALAERSRPDLAEHALVLEARAQLRLAQGDPDAALADARAAGDIAQGKFGTRSSRIFDWTRIAADAAHASGRHDEARELAADAVARARAGAVARRVGDALRTEGVIAGGADGLALLEEATAVLETSPSRLSLIQALVAHGGALRRAGKRTDAAEALLRALELADAAGASPLVATARDELRTLGLRPRRAARSGASALTPSEQRVAQLAAEGLSTPQLASRLYLSTKTVESHLTRVYRKLDISRRSELGGALARRGPRQDAPQRT